jgi:hypothetical protein
MRTLELPHPDDIKGDPQVLALAGLASSLALAASALMAADPALRHLGVASTEAVHFSPYQHVSRSLLAMIMALQTAVESYRHSRKQLADGCHEHIPY